HQRQGLALGLEPGNDLVRVHARLDDFDGDAAAKGLRLLGEIDGPHASLTEQLDDVIRAEVAGERAGERTIHGPGPGLLLWSPKCCVWVRDHWRRGGPPGGGGCDPRRTSAPARGG